MRKLTYTSLLVAFVVAAASAQVVPYANRTIFDAAVGGVSNETIIGFTQTQSLTSSFTIGNDTFSGLSNALVEVIDGTNVGSPGNLVLTTNTGDFVNPTIGISFAAPVTAFGTDFKTSTNATTSPPEQVLFQLFDASNNLLSAYSGTVVNGTMFSFAGFTSTTPIASVEIGVVGLIGTPETVLDNITTIPEPSTWFAAVLALAVIGFSQRKRVRDSYRS